MSTTTMRFGPEWMRKQPGKSLAATPPTSQNAPQSNGNGSSAPPGTSTYSSLVTPTTPSSQGKRDVARPFSYSRDEMLRIWKDGGGRSALPIEVERWEGIVKEDASEPVTLREFSDVEKQLYATSLNSEPRRRQQSVDQTTQDRGKSGLNGGGGGLMRRRRGDSSGSEHPPINLGRKSSWSGGAVGLNSPGLASPRTRFGGGNGFDGVLDRSDNPWVGGPKRRNTSGQVMSERVEEADEEIKVSEGPGGKDPGETKQELILKDDLASVKDVKEVEDPMSKLSLGDSARTADKPESDPAKIRWSYIDPTNNVQGPFPGDTMQSWNDQGYFNDTLMMKRVDIDTDFMPLSEIKRRAQGPRIFLASLNNNTPPPGLGPLPEGPNVNLILHQKPSLDASHDSSPHLLHRTASVDPFLSSGNIPTGSASPSSSLGVGFARGPGTPDPMVLGSRLASRFATESPIAGRTGVVGYAPSDSPAMPQAMRQIHNDLYHPSRASSFDTSQSVPWQAGQASNVQAWLGGTNNITQQNYGSHTPDSHFPSHGSAIDPFFGLQDPSRAFHDQQSQGASENGMQFVNTVNHVNNPYQQQVQTQGFPDSHHRPQPLPALNTGHGHDMNHALAVSPSPLSANGSTQNNFGRQMTPISPWGGQVVDTRPRPFDSDFPRADNTFVMAPSSTTNSAWEKPIEQRPASDPWGLGNQSNQVSQEPQSLTTANVNQHNEQQQTLEKKEPETAAAESKVTNPSSAVLKTEAVALLTEDTSAKALPTTSKSKRKPSTTAKEAVIAQQEQSVPPTVKLPPPTSQKAPWATEDDSKQKAAHPLNLREIQEMEMKTQEARRAKEERERAVTKAAATTSVSTPVSDEVSQFTTSWGLPTSKAGGRASAAVATKDGPASNSAAVAPVWTNAAKPAAKTMKEIQEEEERRKQVQAKETAASAVKKATGPPPKTATPAVPTGGPWSVVGAGGKGGSTIVKPPVAQTSAPAVSAARPTSVVSTARMASTSLVAKAPPKAETDPLPPSTDFLKWMRDSLSGLDSSIRFEEIAQMLLMFPIDPDASTVDLIAETVYGASTLIDGRRFAREFVTRRKDDQLRSNGSGANAKTTSLADVVKAQPKQVQNEFAGYKVVKKKGKRT